MNVRAMLARVKSLSPWAGSSQHGSDQDAVTEALVKAAREAQRNAVEAVRQAYIPADERLKQVLGKRPQARERP